MLQPNLLVAASGSLGKIKTEEIAGLNFGLRRSYVPTRKVLVFQMQLKLLRATCFTSGVSQVRLCGRRCSRCCNEYYFSCWREGTLQSCRNWPHGEVQSAKGCRQTYSPTSTCGEDWSLRYKVHFASEFVATRVAMALCLETEIQATELLRSFERVGAAGSMRGILFKAYAARQLAAGGSFTIKEIGSETYMNLDLTPTAILQKNTKL